MEAENKVAIVAGGSRGIGAAIARRLGEDGFLVLVNYSGDAAAAEKLVVEIEQAGGRAVTAQAALSDPRAAARLFDAAQAAYGGVDVLVNNAGVMQPGVRPGAMTDIGDRIFDDQISVHLKGAFNALREAARRLRDDGRIINLSWRAPGPYPQACPAYAATEAAYAAAEAAYAAAEAAIAAMTRILAKELRGRRITVNAVAARPAANREPSNGKPGKAAGHAARLASLENLGGPRDIAATVGFLAGPGGSWVNGQVIRANGGIS